MLFSTAEPIKKKKKIKEPIFLYYKREVLRDKLRKRERDSGKRTRGKAGKLNIEFIYRKVSWAYFVG